MTRSQGLSCAIVVDVGPARFAVMPESQWAGIYAVATAALVYWLSVQLFGRRQRVLWLIAALVLSGSVTAVAGLCQVFGGWDWFMWLYKGAEKTASAGYPNRDHFAQLCAMTVFVSLGLSVGVLTAPHGSRMAEWAAGRRWLGWLSAACAVAALLAVIFSYSRAAVLAVVAGLILFTAAIWFGRGKRTVSLPMAAVGLALFIASFYGLDVLSERVAFVLSGTDPSALVRREIWETVAQVIAMSPWFGSGWDGVLALAPTFDTSYVPGFIVNAAHNDYLEILVAVGVPVGSTVLLLGSFFYGKAVLRTVSIGRRGSSFFPVAAGLLIGLTVVLAQEFVEYGLKQPANLMAFAVAAGALGLVLKTAEAGKNPDGRQPVLTAGTYGGITVVLVVAASFAWVSTGLVQEGWRQAMLETVLQSARQNDTLSEDVRQHTVRVAAERVLAVNPRNASALAAEIENQMAAAESERRRYRATALSQVLERPVSPRQAEHLVYAPYWATADARIPDNNRRHLVEVFSAGHDAALRLAALTPSNALAVSIAAGAADDAVQWGNGGSSSLALHRYAAALYPSNTTVLIRSLRGLARAVLESKDKEERAPLMAEFETNARVLTEQAPADLKWILPTAQALGMSNEAVKALVLAKIEGQERYAQWRLEQGDFEAALSALNEAERLNADRLDDEKPWTMGRAAYLQRERREKIEVAQTLDELRLKAFVALKDDAAVAKVSERLKARQATINSEQLARADELIAKGEWVLADAVLKKMPQDPRALVRRAEMALTMNRIEGAGQRMKEYEAVAERADEETRVRAAEVMVRLR